MSPGVWAVALAIALLHMLTNGRYGFHRDELQFLSDSRHLDWGFVSYPPLTPVVERLSSAVFGLWLPGLRLASMLAQVGVVLMAGAMTRLAGGGRGAQVVAALAVGLSPIEVFEGTEFQYTSFDLLWSVLAYFAVFQMVAPRAVAAPRAKYKDPSPAAQDDGVKRVAQDDGVGTKQGVGFGDPRWWLLVGFACGLGVETKYTLVFLIAGLLCGFAFTPARVLLRSRWFAAAVAITLLLALPNLIWQARHGFISLHFLQSIHARDMEEGRGKGVWTDQLWVAALSATVPVWLAGLWRAVRESAWRPIAWMWAVPLAVFGFTHARGYYAAPEYPMLLALGVPVWAAWLAGQARALRRSLLAVWSVAFAANAGLVIAMLVPLAGSGPLKAFALKSSDDLRAELGWAEIAARVAAIRDSLPPEQRASYGVIAGNYGAQGAVEILGRQYGLPVPISRTNSAWLRGYPEPPPRTLIVLGFSPEGVEEIFTGCRVAGSTHNAEGVENEESRYRPNIYVCQGLKMPWPEFWRKYQSFG